MGSRRPQDACEDPRRLPARPGERRRGRSAEWGTSPLLCRLNKLHPAPPPQAGKQLEYVTGGYIEAGFHEVVVDAHTTAAIERAKATGRSTWRISSTLFGHFASDVTLEPLGRFGEDPAVRARFPPIFTGDQVAAELAAIKLASPDAVAAQ